MQNNAETRCFTFVDLFAGIGGMRLAFEDNGGKCVFASEWDPYCVRTYRENFQDDHPIAGDLWDVDVRDVPDHDVLLAGFPCQPFSIAGVVKRTALGKPHGFRCPEQGTVFFQLARVLEQKRPKAFLLENVKNLVSHEGGNTYRLMRQVLEEDLGYQVCATIVDARRFVPQHRERILIAGFRRTTTFDWSTMKFPPPETAPTLRSILHPEDGTERSEVPYTHGRKAEVAAKYVLSGRLWEYLRRYARRHRARGNGFGYGLVGPDDVARTLSARYYKDGSEILVRRGRGRNPRRLTPRECARLMGFPDTFRIPVSDSRAYRQFGNSVAVSVIREAARIMKPHIMELINVGRGLADVAPKAPSESAMETRAVETSLRRL